MHYVWLLDLVIVISLGGHMTYIPLTANFYLASRITDLYILISIYLTKEENSAHYFYLVDLCLSNVCTRLVECTFQLE